MPTNPARRNSPTRVTSGAKRKADLERELVITKDALETALALSPERDNNFFASDYPSRMD